LIVDKQLIGTCDGHEIAAVIAADKLTQAAQRHLASIVSVSTDKIAAAILTRPELRIPTY
jgi:hypothetical protein